MKEVTPKKVVSRIRNQKKKQIYFFHETWTMLKRNAECDDLKDLEFLACSETITYKGKICSVLKLEQVNTYKTEDINGREPIYVSPENPTGITVI